MSRTTALALTSIVSALAPATAAQAAEYDFTLGLVSRATDLALGFEFRATEHFAWGFDVGVSFVDEAGLSLGLGAKYFPAADFRGFYVGFDGAYAAFDDASLDGAIAARSTIGVLFGHKWIVDPGLTIDIGAGPGLTYAEDVDADSDTVVVTDPLAPTLIVNASLGWSF